MDKLEYEANKALEQIKEKKYATEMASRGVREIIRIGAVFYREELKDKYKLYNPRKKEYFLIPISVSSASILSGEPRFAET